MLSHIQTIQVNSELSLATSEPRNALGSQLVAITGSPSSVSSGCLTLHDADALDTPTVDAPRQSMVSVARR